MTNELEASHFNHQLLCILMFVWLRDEFKGAWKVFSCTFSLQIYKADNKIINLLEGGRN